MKILVLSSRVPWPLEKGDKLRLYNQVKYLAERHEVILCALTEEKKFLAENPFADLNVKFLPFYLSPLSKAINIIRAGVGGKPFQVGYFYNAGIHARIRSLMQVEKPDVVYCQLIRMAEYVSDLPIPVKVIDYMDALSAGMEKRKKHAGLLSPLVILEANRLKKYETQASFHFNRQLVISQQDRQLLQHVPGELTVVPNGVDESFFTRRPLEKKFDIIFSGNMSYPPNVLAAERLVKEILPIVRTSIPGVTVVLAGTDPSRRVQKLASSSVTVTGWVKDLQKYYAASNIFVAPLTTGSGMQNKLLESMATGLPSITSPLSAAGICAVNGEHLLVAGSAEEYASHLVMLLRDPVKAKQLGQAGQAFISDRYRWKRVNELLELQLIAR